MAGKKKKFTFKKRYYWIPALFLILILIIYLQISASLEFKREIINYRGYISPYITKDFVYKEADYVHGLGYHKEVTLIYTVNKTSEAIAADLITKYRNEGLIVSKEYTDENNSWGRSLITLYIKFPESERSLHIKIPNQQSTTNTVRINTSDWEIHAEGGGCYPNCTPYDKYTIFKSTGIGNKTIEFTSSQKVDLLWSYDCTNTPHKIFRIISPIYRHEEDINDTLEKDHGIAINTIVPPFKIQTDCKWEIEAREL